jgi:ATP-binding cassette subfamily B protein/subfamily B ATP-binding cassette protein MsbA
MSNKEAVWKLIVLLKEYKKTLLFIMGGLLISSVLNLWIPLLSKQIMDFGFIEGDYRLLIKLVLLSTIIYIVNLFIDVIKEKKRVEISAKIQYSLSEQSFAHLMKLDVSYFNKINYAEIMNNINADVNKMSSIADSSVFFVVTQVFSMIGGIVGLFIIDFRMTFLVLAFIPIKYIVMKYFAKRQKAVMDDFILKSQNYAGWFGDTVGGINEVKLFNIFNKKYKEFKIYQKKVIDKQKEMNMLNQWNVTTDLIMLQILSTVLYIVGANLVFNFQLSIGSVFAFITYSAYVTGPISAILNIGYLLSGIIPSTKRYYNFMALHEEDDNGNLIVPNFGELVLKNIFFGYETDKPILIDVNIDFQKGSKTALIGRNGSGKTTIINLLTRLYAPINGKILLNGTDISMISLQEYRNMVSVVSQQIYLFNDTIRNNICLYEQMDDAVIEEACKDSGLEDFIKEVSLDYMVGQNGAMLSGGQKQKIALARALIHNKPIIIFDEATSNTDAYSEQQINGLLNTKLKEKTVIVITHKKEILSKVDQIVVLKEGVVDDIGTYDELVGKNDELNIMMEKAD